MEQEKINSSNEQNEIKKDTKSKKMLILIIILAILILSLVGYIIYDKLNDALNNNSSELNENTNNVEDNSENLTVDKQDVIVNKIEKFKNIDLTSINKNNLLETINGYWYVFDESKDSIYMTIFDKSSNYFHEAMYRSDDSVSGEVRSIDNLGNNVYRINIYSEGCINSLEENCMYETEPEEFYADVDISELNTGVIYVDLSNSNIDTYNKKTFVSVNMDEAYNLFDNM